MAVEYAAVDSVCVYCGSSTAADPAYIEAARAFGAALAGAGQRLIYGGGGIGLMGAVARGAHEAGGRVLGVMPEFLLSRERLFNDVETVVVQSMHERKMIMFEKADAFVVLPGGIGTLEEIVELLSWQRLDLHRKPIVFYSPGGFWEPLFALFQHTIDHKLTPSNFMLGWRSVERVEDILPTIAAMAAESPNPDAHPRTPQLT